jgi:cysteine synthase A
MQANISEYIKKDEQTSLLNKLSLLEEQVGNTPLIKLPALKGVYTKAEYFQIGNSIKIRPAVYIIRKAIEEGLINDRTVIIESTSGNFGIALAIISHFLGLRFIAVIDKNTPKQKEDLLKLYKSEVVLISEKDECGGYLLNRIRYVEQVKKDLGSSSFHPNQYQNKNNPESYFNGLGKEICAHFNTLDAIVISVSSTGTITGLSQKLKQYFPNIKVIAVDVKGSQIFQKIPFERKLSGIGSSIASIHIENALIDKVVILSEEEVLQACKELLNEQLIFAGPSSGAAYCVVKRYKEEFPEDTVLFISPDSGSSYLKELYT